MMSRKGVVVLAVLLAAFGCGGSDDGQVSRVSYPEAQVSPKPAMPIEAQIPEDPLQQAEVGVRYIAFGMMLYYSHVGNLPSEEEGIEALLQEPHKIEGSDTWAGPYCEEDVVRADPWGNPYHYRLDDSLPLKFEVLSTGPDGVESGDDILSSRDARLPSLEEFERGLAELKASGNLSKARTTNAGNSAPAPMPGDANAPR